MTANPSEKSDNNGDNKGGNSNRRPSELSTSDTVDLEGSVPFLGKPQLLDSIMCRQIIGPRCKLGLKFRVLQPDLELRWRFRTLKGKMTFGIYRQRIISKEKANAQDLRSPESTRESLKDLRNLMEDTEGNDLCICGKTF